MTSIRDGAGSERGSEEHRPTSRYYGCRRERRMEGVQQHANSYKRPASARYELCASWARAPSETPRAVASPMGSAAYAKAERFGRGARGEIERARNADRVACFLCGGVTRTKVVRGCCFRSAAHCFRARRVRGWAQHDEVRGELERSPVPDQRFSALRIWGSAGVPWQ